jgi:hypothetical protein
VLVFAGSAAFEALLLLPASQIKGSAERLLLSLGFGFPVEVKGWLIHL